MKPTNLLLPLICCGIAGSSLSAAMFVVTDGGFDSTTAYSVEMLDDSTLGAGWHVGNVDDTTRVAEGAESYLSLDKSGGWFAQTLSTTDVTGTMYLNFDVKMTDVTDNGPAEAPFLGVSLVGETNPWNGTQAGSGNIYLNQNKEHADIFPVWPDADRASIASNPSTQPTHAVDLSLANSTSWTTYSIPIDMGAGFNHSQGGTAGAPVAQLMFEYTDVYGWAGDELYVDNVRFEAVPEPSTVAFALGAISFAFVAYRRRR